MKIEFRSDRSPAHHVRTTGHKFVAGSLIVPEAAAPAIRAYAAKYPQFGIREIRQAPVPAPAPAAPPRLSRRAPRPATPAPAPISTPPDPVAPGASDAVDGEPTFAAAAAAPDPELADVSDDVEPPLDPIAVDVPPAPDPEDAE